MLKKKKERERLCDELRFLHWPGNFSFRNFEFLIKVKGAVGDLVYG